jgi:hypothetical protein
MRVLGSLLVVASTFAATTARADDAKRAPQVEAIRSLIGNWTGKGSVTSEGKSHAVRVTYDCAESTAAAGIKCKFGMTGLPGFTYEFDDLWGYSAQDNLTHWYTVTNAGEVHDHRGHLDMNGGFLQYETATEGKVFTESITFKRTAKSMTLSWTANHGGMVREKGEVTLSMKAK